MVRHDELLGDEEAGLFLSSDFRLELLQPSGASYYPSFNDCRTSATGHAALASITRTLEPPS
jgi:hypothetical protein